MTSDAARSELTRVLKSMDGVPPAELVDTVQFFQSKAKCPVMSETEVVDELTSSNLNNPARILLQLLISKWDVGDAADWNSVDAGGHSSSNSSARRAQIYQALKLSGEAAQRLDVTFPLALGPIVIDGRDGEWDHWYTLERQASRDFYWKAYSGLLTKQGWSGDALARLDTASTAVVKHLADPTWTVPYQSKGLVVGYVQSGKTANFTGVIAKAIDAGYRLIIVLTGTVEILRSQTQRRLDMELVGEENILGAISKDDAVKMATTDYVDDKDWHEGKFLRHGIPIHETDDVPGIRRLSTRTGDYRRLKQGLSTLDFRAGHELVNKKLPLYSDVNLWRSDVRIAIVKKNSSVLQRLVDDLGVIHAKLGEIPALIIDDEADQASVNTKRPDPKRADAVERTAINKRISDLLGLLKRCQYVGYTATPFANVFIDPDDSEDIFPKDFIVSLERPAGYMGASDFHDLDVDYGDEPKTIHNSNEKDFVRDLWADTPDKREAELREALDAFLLSGAIKLYRRSLGAGSLFRHHTMLIHESVKKIDHANLAIEVRELWKQAGYSGPIGLARLELLWEKDFRPVAHAVAARLKKAATLSGAPEPDLSDMPLPDSFKELRPFIGKALDAIQTGTSPVIVVNGESNQDYEQDALDFLGTDVWKILIGGAKLSRGFTVEGLTVSYYTRRTQQADTLMQMGRWYGFRTGYRDLVRLYVGRAMPGPRKNTTVDLYEAFEAVVQDEEKFREELRKFADPDSNDGMPQVRPEDVPPMVFQHLPWLKPTATNKMYNAELARQGVGGQLVDFPMQPKRPADGAFNTKHFKLAVPLLSALDSTAAFEYKDDTTGKIGNFDAQYGVFPAAAILEFTSGFSWTPNYSFAPYRRFMQDLVEAGTLDEFVVVLPILAGSVKRAIGTCATPFPIITRKRRGDRPGFSGSSKRQRDAIETIAGARNALGELNPSGGPAAVDLHTKTRGAMLLTLALDMNDQAKNYTNKPLELPPGSVPAADIATIFSYALPYWAAPRGKIGFVTKKSGGRAIVDRTNDEL